jgi:hypothetical protein
MFHKGEAAMSCRGIAKALVGAALAVALVVPAAATAKVSFVLRTPALGPISEKTPIEWTNSSMTLVGGTGSLTCPGTSIDGYVILRGFGPVYAGEIKKDIPDHPTCTGDIGLGAPGDVHINYGEDFGHQFLWRPSGKSKGVGGSFSAKFPEAGNAECALEARSIDATFAIGAHGAAVPLVLNIDQKLKRTGFPGSPACPKTAVEETSFAISAGGEAVEVEKAK